MTVVDDTDVENLALRMRSWEFDVHDVERILGLGRHAINRRIKNGRIPPPVRYKPIGGANSGFKRIWTAEQIARVLLEERERDQ